MASDRMSRQEWERIKVEDFDRLEADLAQATARADAFEVAYVALKETFRSIEWAAPKRGYESVHKMRCPICEATLLSGHCADCLIAAALLAADPAQRGAELLVAADAMAEQIEELNGEYLGCELAAQAYRRLRGGRGPENGDE